MAEKKLTKKDYFAKIAKIVEGDAELEAFVAHEIELLNKKGVNRSETKTQKENASIKEAIINALINVGKAVTITELQAFDTAMAEYSNQKLSALLKQLVDNGEVVKVIDKKKSYFSVKSE